MLAELNVVQMNSTPKLVAFEVNLAAAYISFSQGIRMTFIPMVAKQPVAMVKVINGYRPVILL